MESQEGGEERRLESKTNGWRITTTIIPTAGVHGFNARSSDHYRGDGDRKKNSALLFVLYHVIALGKASLTS